MCHAVHAVHNGLNSHLLEVEDVDEALVECCLYTRQSSPVDLLIRTSGETRLSDFLLWQCRYAMFVFADVLWPDYSFFDFMSAILEYHRKAYHLDNLRRTQGGIMQPNQNMFS